MSKPKSTSVQNKDQGSDSMKCLTPSLGGGLQESISKLKDSNSYNSIFELLE